MNLTLPNDALQAAKGKLSRHLPRHMARQLAYAAGRGRYATTTEAAWWS